MMETICSTELQQHTVDTQRKAELAVHEEKGGEDGGSIAKRWSRHAAFKHSGRQSSSRTICAEANERPRQDTMWRTAGSALRNQVASLVVPSSTVTKQPLAAVSTQIVRRFAGKAEPKEEHVEVPIAMYGVTGKYASALYVTALRGSVLEPVEQELKSIISTADGNDVFSEFLKDPSVSKDTRMKAIQEIFGKESSYSDVTKNFLAVLAENGRLSSLHKISTAYSELVLAHKGEVTATVTSALELTQEELNGIKDSLKGHLKPGQVLNIEQKVDRSIIGGIVIDILDKHIDLSIDTRIKQMEKVLAENF